MRAFTAKHYFRAFIALLLAAQTSPLSGHALIIDGKEVEDIYAYIVKTLDEEAQLQEEYQTQVERNPAYAGYRPYTYSSLRHLSTEDLVYGAMQGGMTARRELGPEAASAEVAARAEANINRVMELFPMLAKDFNTGEVLLKRMVGTGRLDYFQLYLLKRSRPGHANDSLFAAFWREEVQRNQVAYRKVLEEICDSAFSQTESLQYAIPFYAEIVEQEYRAAFERDAGVTAMLAEGIPNLTPHAVLSDPALRARLANAAALESKTRELVFARKRFEAQLDPNMARAPHIVAMVEDFLDKFDKENPSVREYAEQMADKLPVAPIPLTAMPEPEPEESPESEASKPDVPKIGIPTLQGF